MNMDNPFAALDEEEHSETEMGPKGEPALKSEAELDTKPEKMGGQDRRCRFDLRGELKFTLKD